jgi:hypothetical protein
MKSLKSSNLKAAGFENGTLVVEFKKGSTWAYKGVPQETYDQLMAAESAGSFFHRNIRNVYEAKKLETAQ